MQLLNTFHLIMQIVFCKYFFLYCQYSQIFVRNTALKSSLESKDIVTLSVGSSTCIAPAGTSWAGIGAQYSRDFGLYSSTLCLGNNVITTNPTACIKVGRKGRKSCETELRWSLLKPWGQAEQRHLMANNLRMLLEQLASLIQK